ncbi:hypothetical protein [Streptomyces sp. SID14478]|nr:hypothetical protein [Streptomyces sp. SID14478]
MSEQRRELQEWTDETAAHPAARKYVRVQGSKLPTPAAPGT